ncbi:MAG: DarT ssDNA thymidine ADP-ribosyltransferase family protein, partial [Planctomycetota bacterium]
ISALNNERLFARYWTHPDNKYEQDRHRSEKMSEVLIPDCINLKFIIGAYVANQQALETFQRLNLKNLTVEIKSDIFF